MSLQRPRSFKKVRKLAVVPELNFFIFAALLNFPWEFIQVPLYAEMADAGHWDAIRLCTRATLGDATILLVAYWIAAVVARDRWWFVDWRWLELAAFLAAGLAITLMLEHLATVSTRPGWGWRYSELMPVVPVIGIGLSPLAQWLLLPPLALWLVRRQLEGRGPERRCRRA